MLLIINRYLLKNFIKNGVVIFLTFNSIFLLMNFTKIGARLSKFGISFAKIFYLSSLIVPLSAFQTLSYVFFLALFITLSSVFRSNELIIYKSIGMDYKKLMRPIIIFTMIAFLVSIFLETTFPLSIRKYTDLKNFYSSSNILSSMKKKTFNTFNNSTIVFKNVDRNDNIKDIIMVKKEKNTSTIILAEKGEIGFEGEDIILRLDLNRFIEIGEDGKSLKISENEYSEVALTDHFTMDPDKVKPNKITNPVLLSIKELKENIMDKEYAEEFHKRILTPIQILIIGFVCGLILLKKTTPRVTSVFRDIFIFAFFGYIVSLNQFILPVLIEKNFIYLLYIHHLVIVLLFAIWFLFKRYNIKN